MKKLILIVSLLAIGSLIAFAAAADGSWSISGTIPTAPQQLSFTTNGAALTGTIDGVAIANGSAQANTIHFQATRGGITYNYKGTISASKLSLFEEAPTGGGRALTYFHN